MTSVAIGDDNYEKVDDMKARRVSTYYHPYETEKRWKGVSLSVRKQYNIYSLSCGDDV